MFFWPIELPKAYRRRRRRDPRPEAPFVMDSIVIRYLVTTSL